MTWVIAYCLLVIVFTIAYCIIGSRYHDRLSTQRDRANSTLDPHALHRNEALHTAATVQSNFTRTGLSNVA